MLTCSIHRPRPGTQRIGAGKVNLLQCRAGRRLEDPDPRRRGARVCGDKVDVVQQRKSNRLSLLSINRHEKVDLGRVRQQIRSSVVLVNGSRYNLRERCRMDTFRHWRIELQRLQFDKHARRRGCVVVLVRDYKIRGGNRLFIAVTEDIRLALDSFLAPNSSLLPKLRKVGWPTVSKRVDRQLVDDERIITHRQHHGRRY